MSTKIDKVAPRQEVLAGLLARGTSIRNAAEEMGIAPSTVYRWARKPAVIARVRQIQVEVTGSAVATLKENLQTSVNVLVSLAEDESIPPQVRCSAAGRLLETGIRVIETAEVLERLRALEERFD